MIFKITRIFKSQSDWWPLIINGCWLVRFDDLKWLLIGQIDDLKWLLIGQIDDFKWLLIGQIDDFKWLLIGHIDDLNQWLK